ncbi:MAG: hypothetical protein FWC30_03425 [Candidatus Bathyarchaeota archaeon]|nr:hypothetical protein [Candidatus Termiticorpusculum sp.]
MSVSDVIAAGVIPQIESEIYQKEDAFFPDSNTIKNLQKKLLIESFEFHYNNNEVYRRYCDAVKVGIVEVKQDVRNIPLIPSTVFKTMKLRTDTNEKTVKSCLSSGTQGSVSTVERDNTTLERFLGTIRNVTDNVYGLEDAIILNLGPSSEEAKDLWFSYVMSVSDLLFPEINYVIDDVFRIDLFIKDINRYKDSYRDIMVIGAPIMFTELHKYFLQNNISLDYGDKIFVITAGGWKKNEGKALTKEKFRSLCKDMFLNITDDRIRDAFNMVELNTVLPECECGSKHVPLWVDVFAINLDTYKVAAVGEVGLLGFLDASPISYPGFVMSGDLGRITHVNNCPCGRNGVCVDIVRRVNTIESRGCALKIERKYFQDSTE